MLFAGECKYHNQPVDADVFFNLKAKVEESAEMQVAFKDYKILYGVFSKSNFTIRLLDICSSVPNLFLINEDHIVSP